MKYEFSREEMHYLLKGEHISLFGNGEPSLGKSEKIRQRLIKEGLFDQAGVPVPELAAALWPLSCADDELSCPLPFVDFSDVSLRSTIFFKKGKMSAARKEGRLKLRFILEALDNNEQAEQAVAPYLDLYAVKRWAEPFSFTVTTAEVEALSVACVSNDLTMIREAARKHGVPLNDLVIILQDVLVDMESKTKTLLASRLEERIPGTLVLKIHTELGLVVRWVTGVPNLPAESIIYFEAIPKGSLIDFLLDYKGY